MLLKTILKVSHQDKKSLDQSNASAATLRTSFPDKIGNLIRKKQNK